MDQIIKNTQTENPPENMNQKGRTVESSFGNYFSSTDPEARNRELERLQKMTERSEEVVKMKMENDIKMFESMLLLGDQKITGKNAISDREMKMYREAKQAYADKYLEGKVPDSLITSFQEAKDFLEFSGAKGFEEIFDELEQKHEVIKQKIAKQGELIPETVGTHTVEQVIERIERE